MRHLLTTLLALAAIVALTRPASAQCTPYGQPCTSSGMLLICSSPPRTGTAWRIGERSAACGLSSTNPGPIFTIYGFCLTGGVPVGAPLACSGCGGCSLHVLPALGAIAWTWPPRTYSITIPQDPMLVGATFCMQDVCVDQGAACLCISPAIQVVVQ